MIIFLWLLLIFSFLAVVSLFLTKIPEVAEKRSVRVAVHPTHESIPAFILSKVKLAVTKLWHFILEAKDLTPPISSALTHQVEKVKKVFHVRVKSSKTEPDWMPEVADEVAPDENIFLANIKKNPEDKNAYEGLGRLYLQEKKYAEAEEIFQYLINLDPAKDTYHSNLGLILYSLQKYPEAIAAYEKALSLNNKVPVRWVNLGLSFMAQDDLTRSIRAVSNALQLDPRNINYLSLLADVYMRAKNRIRAEEVLQQILQLDPTNRGAREKLMRLKI